MAKDKIVIVQVEKCINMNICMIPVRKGSQRLAKKNYLKINGKQFMKLLLKKHFL